MWKKHIGNVKYLYSNDDFEILDANLNTFFSNVFNMIL